MRHFHSVGILYVQIVILNSIPDIDRENICADFLLFFVYLTYMNTNCLHCLNECRVLRMILSSFKSQANSTALM